MVLAEHELRSTDLREMGVTDRPVVVDAVASFRRAVVFRVAGVSSRPLSRPTA